MSLSQHELEFAHNYFFGDKSLFLAESPLCQKLFVSYVQDKNSSTIREEVTLKHLGIKKFAEKHGPDGLDEKTQTLIEVKPGYAHVNPKTGKPKRLGGGGTFNDVTPEKLKTLESWDVVSSGFAEDICLFVIRHPAKYIIPYLTAKYLENTNPNREKQLVRPGTIGFGYKQFIDCPDLQILHFDQVNGKKYMNGVFYKQLLAKVK